MLPDESATTADTPSIPSQPHPVDPPGATFHEHLSAGEADSSETEAGTDEELVPERPAPQFRIKRVLLAVLAAIVLMMVNVSFSNSAFYRMTPGPAPDVTAGISGDVPDKEFGQGGHLYFTTVEVTEISWWEWARIRYLGDKSELVPASQLGSEDSAERAAAAAAQMRESKKIAWSVASSRVTGGPGAAAQGVRVLSVVPGSAAERAGLSFGDLLLAVDQKPLSSAEEVKSLVEASGGELSVLVRQGEKENLIPVELDEVDGSYQLGVQLNTVLDAEPGLEVSTEGIGGPSAGLMFSLAFTDALTEGDLTAGRRIAGTGTISPNGEVGPIGGVSEKVVGARKEGATVFLAPAGNYPAAKEAAPEGLEVVSVSTYEDALGYLCTSGGKSPVCTTA